jgi:aspartate kinase
MTQASRVIVQKYGGSSVANVDRIRHVAERVARRRREGNRMVVVVSAMGDTTDDLISLARQVTVHPRAREMDVLLSTGEMVSSSLLTMALHELNEDAVSLTGLQAGIQTDSVYSKARIMNIDSQRLRDELDRGRTVVVAGFQGVTTDLDVTTLGRGGSDPSAVALAIALKAEQCERYTDVDGVYTTDPRIEPNARKLRDIGYEEMLELASHGAKIMHPRAVELAQLYGLPILVASSFSDEPGTLIHGGPAMEPINKVRGIAHDFDVAKITVRGVPDQPGIAAAMFGPLADSHISIDTIVQNSSLENLTDMTFTVAKGDLSHALEIAEPLAAAIGATGIAADSQLGKVSIVGTGMQNTPGYAARMFRTLADSRINIELITTSEIRITCIIAESDVLPAVRALHRAFELESPE